jgi:hypothetical protein
VIRNLIKDPYCKIFNHLYDITEGKVILSGSLGLKLLNIIKRDTNDLDVTLSPSDWKKYKGVIEKLYRVYPGLQLRYGGLEYDVYTCFDKITKLNEFHLFVNYGENLYVKLDNIRIFNPNIQLIDKEMIVKSGLDDSKHMEDILLIKSYIYEK